MVTPSTSDGMARAMTYTSGVVEVLQAREIVMQQTMARMSGAIEILQARDVVTQQSVAHISGVLAELLAAQRAAVPAAAPPMSGMLGELLAAQRAAVSAAVPAASPAARNKRCAVPVSPAARVTAKRSRTRETKHTVAPFVIKMQRGETAVFVVRFQNQFMRALNRTRVRHACLQDAIDERDARIRAANCKICLHRTRAVLMHLRTAPDET